MNLEKVQYYEDNRAVQALKTFSEAAQEGERVCQICHGTDYQ